MYGKYGVWAALFARVTGQEWTTTRSCTAEFGPTPGARYRRELAAYTDAELLRYDRDALLAAVERDRESRRGWASPEAAHAAAGDLLRRAARVTDPDEVADLRQQAVEVLWAVVR